MATKIIFVAASVAIGTCTALVVGTYGLVKRTGLKQVDKELAKQRTMERYTEVQQGGPSLPTPIQHCLHPHHTMILTNTTPPIKLCHACEERIKDGEHYNCSENCEFNLHTECALSENMLENLTDKEQLQTFAHDHPLDLEGGKSEFICNQCKTQGNTNYRYSCKRCDKQFHLICAVHPTRLRSFVHPEHELELKVRPYFKKCAICQISGESNTRAYCCKACDFYLHPECAQLIPQYCRSPLHKGHVLVFRKVDPKSCVCKACGDKCKNWCYSCSLCEDFNTIHLECLLGSSNSKLNKISSIVDNVLTGELFKGLLQEGVKEAVIGSVKKGVVALIKSI